MLTKILKTSLSVKVIAIFGKYTNICFQKIPTPGLMLYVNCMGNGCSILRIGRNKIVWSDMECLRDLWS